MTERKDFTESCVVRLKTGGPFMIVEDTRRDDAVACVWFAGETACRDAFHHLALELIPDSALKPPVMNYTASDIAEGALPIGCKNMNAGHVTWLSDEEFHRQTVEAR